MNREFLRDFQIPFPILMALTMAATYMTVHTIVPEQPRRTRIMDTEIIQPPNSNFVEIVQSKSYPESENYEAVLGYIRRKCGGSEVMEIDFRRFLLKKGF